MRELWDDPVGVWALLELWALLCWAKPWQGLCGASCVVPVPLGLWGCCEGSRDTQSTAGHATGPAVGVWGQPRLPCAHSSALVWSTQWPGQAGGSGQGPPWDQQSQIISSVCPWRRCRQLPSPHSTHFMLWGGQRGKSVCEEGLGAEMLLPSLQLSGCAPRRLWLLGELCSFSVRFPACSRFFPPSVSLFNTSFVWPWPWLVLAGSQHSSGRARLPSPLLSQGHKATLQRWELSSAPLNCCVSEGN